MHGPPTGQLRTSWGRRTGTFHAATTPVNHNQAMSDHCRLCVLQGPYVGKGVVAGHWTLGIPLHEYPQPHWESESFTLPL